ncbi:MAG: hypothetical protein IJT12_08120 [Paludibacteraceae bacterium]|nr:hypothetical protein [Paludibacteraceae bacterium]
MDFIYLIVIFLCLSFLLLGLIYGYQLIVINRKLETQELQRKLAEKEAEEWREKLLDKVKEKISITEQARNRITHGEDLVAKFIYHQQGIEELSTELFAIYHKPISAVKKKYPDLTELDLLVLCLLGIGMDNVEICAILHMEKRTLYRRRQLIAMRIGMSSTNLETFARSILQEVIPDTPEPQASPAL